MDRLDVKAAHCLSPRRNLQRPDDLERGHNLAKMAVIAVVLMAENDQIRRLGNRLVTSRVGRAVRVEDDPQPLRLDQEGCMSIPRDAHRASLSCGRSRTLA